MVFIFLKTLTFKKTPHDAICFSLRFHYCDMTLPSKLAEILNRIAEGHYTDSDIQILGQALQKGGTQDLWQFGKYNINIGEQGQNIQIGDRTYVTWNEDAIKSLVQALGEQNAEKGRPTYIDLSQSCQNKVALKKYLSTTFEKLRLQGCSRILKTVQYDDYFFAHAARIPDFEISIGPIGTRGEAFFVFSEFSTIQLPTLRRFSGQCHQ